MGRSAWDQVARLERQAASLRRRVEKFHLAMQDIEIKCRCEHCDARKIASRAILRDMEAVNESYKGG